MSLSNEQRLHKCRQVLNWYLEHQHLHGVTNSNGRSFDELESILDDALGRMPAHYQQIIYYRFVQGQQPNEIQLLVGLSKTSYFVHQRDAVLILAEIIGDEVLSTWSQKMYNQR